MIDHPQPFDTVVIGGGPSGLAAGYHLQRQGLRFVILEANTEPVGAWPHYYASLKLFSPARYSALPGLPFPGSPDHYPARDNVIAYLRQYAQHFALPVTTHTRVNRVSRAWGLFRLHTNRGDYLARTVIVASGAFNRPHLPAFPGQAQFAGQIRHAYHYHDATGFEGQRIVVVGGGNSAVQIAAELSRVARVTIATHQPLRFTPQRIGGRDVHFWLKFTGLDAAPASGLSRPPIDSGGYQALLRQGAFDERRLFKCFTADGVIWPDGLAERIDTVILATGYQPNLDFLAELPIGTPVSHTRGLSRTVPGLYFVGLPGQRNTASATLRGAGPDSEQVVKHLRRFIQNQAARPGLRHFLRRVSGPAVCCAPEKA